MKFLVCYCTVTVLYCYCTPCTVTIVHLLTLLSQVVFSVLAVSAHSAPQLLYGGYAGLPYAHTAVHAVPTVAKKTLTYKTAAFEPVEADTPADAKLISLKETEHSYDVLVPGPTKYVSTPVAYNAYAHHAFGKSSNPF